MFAFVAPFNLFTIDKKRNFSLAVITYLSRMAFLLNTVPDCVSVCIIILIPFPLSKNCPLIFETCPVV